MNIKVFIFKNLLFPKCWDSAVVRILHWESLTVFFIGYLGLLDHEMDFEINLTLRNFHTLPKIDIAKHENLLSIRPPHQKNEKMF